MLIHGFDGISAGNEQRTKFWFDIRCGGRVLEDQFLEFLSWHPGGRH